MALFTPSKVTFNSPFHPFSKTQHSVFVLEALEEMWRDELACDFVIKVGEELFAVHKALLVATSDYFKAMISSKMKECKEGVIDMKGVGPKAVQSCLEYVYTGIVALTTDNIIEVLQAASILQLSKLLSACYEFLKKNLNSDTCVLTLQTAQLYDHEELENLSREFFTSHFSQVTVSADFCGLTKDDALRYILEFGTNDNTNWQASKNWIEYEKDIRDEEVGEFFNMLDLIEFPSNSLLKDTWGTEYFRSCDLCMDRMYQRIFSNVLELSDNININNCFVLNEMAASHKYTVQEIHSLIFGFMLKKFTKVTAMLEFIELPEKDVVSLFQSSHAVYFSSERIKWNAAIKWIKARPKERAKVFKVLMKSIAFEKLPQNFVQESVRKESLVKKFPEFQNVLLDAAFSKPAQDSTEKYMAILDSCNNVNILDMSEKKWHPLHFSASSETVNITCLNGHLCVIDEKKLHVVKGGKWWEMASLDEGASPTAQVLPLKDAILLLDKGKSKRYNALTDCWCTDSQYLVTRFAKCIVLSNGESLFILLASDDPLRHVVDKEAFRVVTIPSSMQITVDDNVSAVYCNGSLFLYGMCSGSRSISRYDIATETWKRIAISAHMNGGRKIKLGTINKKLVTYVSDTAAELQLEFYDDQLNEWVHFRNAPTFRSCGAPKSVRNICGFQHGKF